MPFGNLKTRKIRERIITKEKIVVDEEILQQLEFLLGEDLRNQNEELENIYSFLKEQNDILEEVLDCLL